MKKHVNAIIILCTAAVSSLHAYTSQAVTNTVSSLIASPTHFAIKGGCVASPLSQYGAIWTGEILVATNGNCTGNGTVISFANGATNSTKDTFSLIAPSLIKGPVLLEKYTTTTNKYVNSWGTKTTVDTKYIYSADCVLTATNTSNRFLLKGRAMYIVDVTKNDTITSGIGSVDFSTNTSAELLLGAFSTNNSYWGFLYATPY